MDLRDKIIDFLKSSGPIIPVRLAKQFNTNILMASAFLSELSANGKVKVSNLKIGGTPLYYLPGQESKLQSFSANLGAKDKSVYDMLAEKKVLQDKVLEPMQRVALKDMKDFAKAFSVENENYWRWFLISDEEAISIVKLQSKKELSTQEIKEEKKAEIEIKKQVIEETKLAVPVSENKKEPIPEQKILDITETKKIESKKAEDKKVEDKNLEEEKIDTEKILRDFFRKNDIDVIEVGGKKTDLECEIRISSAIGKILCYCRAKFKKRITDADISSAYMQSQYKKLPLVFLYRGELNKKAEDMLRDFPNIIVKRI